MFALFVYRLLFSRTKFVISKKVSCVAEYCMVQFSFVCALKKVSCVAECSFDLSPVLQSAVLICLLCCRVFVSISFRRLTQGRGHVKWKILTK